MRKTINEGDETIISFSDAVCEVFTKEDDPWKDNVQNPWERDMEILSWESYNANID